jgi:hypothetical protein
LADFCFAVDAGEEDRQSGAVFDGLAAALTLV